MNYHDLFFDHETRGFIGNLVPRKVIGDTIDQDTNSISMKQKLHHATTADAILSPPAPPKKNIPKDAHWSFFTTLSVVPKSNVAGNLVRWLP